MNYIFKVFVAVVSWCFVPEGGKYYFTFNSFKFILKPAEHSYRPHIFLKMLQFVTHGLGPWIPRAPNRNHPLFILSGAEAL